MPRHGRRDTPQLTLELVTVRRAGTAASQAVDHYRARLLRYPDGGQQPEPDQLATLELYAFTRDRAWEVARSYADLSAELSRNVHTVVEQVFGHDDRVRPQLGAALQFGVASFLVVDQVQSAPEVAGCGYSQLAVATASATLCTYDLMLADSQAHPTGPGPHIGWADLGFVPLVGTVSVLDLRLRQRERDRHMRGACLSDVPSDAA